MSRLGDDIWEARRTSSTTEPPSKRFGSFSAADAYVIGDELYARRLAGGERRAGLKIGFTNTSVWEALGLAEPIYAPIYESTIVPVRTLPKATLDIGTLVAPLIEPEVVFGIGEDGPEWWAFGFEIVQCHYPNWDLTPADAIADFGLHAVLVLGEPRPLQPAERTALPAFEVDLLCNGEVAQHGGTANVLGGPLLALERLIALTSTSSALPPPQDGEIVTTGTLTTAPRIAAGERWELRPVGNPLEPLVLSFA